MITKYVIRNGMIGVICPKCRTFNILKDSEHFYQDCAKCRYSMRFSEQMSLNHFLSKFIGETK